MKGYLCENCNAFDTEAVDDNYEGWFGRTTRRSPPQGWLHLNTEHSSQDFCSLECVLAWLLRMHEQLPKGHG